LLTLACAALLGSVTARADLSSHPPAPKTFDVSTDARVAEALAAITGRPQSVTSPHGDVCIRHPQSFPDIVRIGFFANDAGCRGDSLFYKGRYYEHSAEALQSVTAQSGWSRNVAARERLARAWSLEILHGFERVLEDPVRIPHFHPPRVAAGAGGVIVMTLWLEDEAGRRPVRAYRRVEDTFSADGARVTERTLEQVTVPY
jgi:hypothetical protein